MRWEVFQSLSIKSIPHLRWWWWWWWWCWYDVDVVDMMMMMMMMMMMTTTTMMMMIIIQDRLLLGIFSMFQLAQDALFPQGSPGPRRPGVHPGPPTLGGAEHASCPNGCCGLQNEDNNGMQRRTRVDLKWIWPSITREIQESNTPIFRMTRI